MASLKEAKENPKVAKDRKAENRKEQVWERRMKKIFSEWVAPPDVLLNQLHSYGNHTDATDPHFLVDSGASIH